MILMIHNKHHCNVTFLTDCLIAVENHTKYSFENTSQVISQGVYCCRAQCVFDDTSCGSRKHECTLHALPQKARSFILLLNGLLK